AAPLAARPARGPRRLPARLPVHFPRRRAVRVLRAALARDAHIVGGRHRDAVSHRTQLGPLRRPRAGADRARDGGDRWLPRGPDDLARRLKERDAMRHGLLRLSMLALLAPARLAQDAAHAPEHAAEPEQWELSGNLFYSDPPGSSDRLTPILYAD